MTSNPIMLCTIPPHCVRGMFTTASDRRCFTGLLYSVAESANFSMFTVV